MDSPNFNQKETLGRQITDSSEEYDGIQSATLKKDNPFLLTSDNKGSPFFGANDSSPGLTNFGYSERQIQPFIELTRNQTVHDKGNKVDSIKSKRVQAL